MKHNGNEPPKILSFLRLRGRSKKPNYFRQTFRIGNVAITLVVGPGILKLIIRRPQPPRPGRAA